MTIARRLLILLTVPLLVLVGIGAFARIQMATIEKEIRFLAEEQIASLAIQGNIIRSFTELRVHVRSYVLTQDKADQVRILGSFAVDKVAVTRLLGKYGDSLVTDDRDRRLYNEFLDLSREWIAGAETIFTLVDAGQRDIALATLATGAQAKIGERLSQVSAEWIRHNEEL